MPSHLGKLLWFATVLSIALLPATASAGDQAQVPPWPSDLSSAGLAAAASNGRDWIEFESILPEIVAERVRGYVLETQALGLAKRSGRLTIDAAPLNVRANNPAGDAIGETQAEVAVAVHGDTVVIGWNDSRGFVAGNTVSSFAYSTNGGATFTDGGNVPLTSPTDGAFGDPGVDTDERGNWYYNQIYTRGGTEQNIAVHRGRFNLSGQLVWNLPVQASIGTGATGFLDKCLLACDRVTGNVYVAYTRFAAVSQIEVVRSTTSGTTWDPAIVLDSSTDPTGSKQAARPFCGPNGEVYVVWEKGANIINCSGSGSLSNTFGYIGFSRSLNFGVSFDPYTNIGIVDHSWTWSGAGDLRERGNEFPDIAVDRSGGPYDGTVYVTWHESAPWTSSLAAGPPRNEAADAANANPMTPETFVIGEDVNGGIANINDLDYWQFNATAGQSLLFNLDPQGFNCGVTGTSRGMRLRLYATQAVYTVPGGFPDSLIAASALGTFADRIVWTVPRTGSYLVRLQRSAGATPFTYRLRVRNLTFGTPSPARDARDVVLVTSTDQGGSWSAEQRINDDPAGLENRRPFASVDGLGHVHLFWHDQRVPGLGSNAVLTSVYGATSRDGGGTWTPNYPVTDELSFFSFNTLAVPNLGDYNQAASSGAVTHPAWSDQRISTGDVRNPAPPPTYSAGRGPDAYTTRVIFDHAVSGDPDATVPIGNVTVDFELENTGTVPDRYDYSITDDQGWIGGPVNGTTATLQPGESVQFEVTAAAPAVCTPTTDAITFTATPVGDPDGAKSYVTHLERVNHAPDAGGAIASYADITSFEHDFASVAVTGVTDAEGSFTLAITGVTQDEPLNSPGNGNTCPDAVIAGDEVAVRIERHGRAITPGTVRPGGGNGRVYGIHFTATDEEGCVTPGVVYVCIPRDQRPGSVCVDDGQTVNSLGPCPASQAVTIDPPAALLEGVNALRVIEVAGSTAKLEYSLARDAEVQLGVFDIAGRRLAALASGSRGAGVHQVSWSSKGLPRGIYFYRLKAGRETVTRSVLHLE